MDFYRFSEPTYARTVLKSFQNLVPAQTSRGTRDIVPSPLESACASVRYAGLERPYGVAVWSLRNVPHV